MVCRNIGMQLFTSFLAIGTVSHHTTRMCRGGVVVVVAGRIATHMQAMGYPANGPPMKWISHPPDFLFVVDMELVHVALCRYRFFFILNRPGFTRINLPYFMKKETVLFILESIVTVAEHGWKLLPKVFTSQVFISWDVKLSVKQNCF